MPKNESRNTYDHIIDVAEQLILKKGIEKVSLREITRVADVNTAAVNYHFGSKYALFNAVLMRLFGPLLNKRINKLQEIENNTTESAVELEAVIRSWLDPLLDRFFDDDGHGPAIYAMEFALGQASQADIPVFDRSPLTNYENRFLSTLARAASNLDWQEVRFRYNCMTGAITEVLNSNGFHDEQGNIDKDKVEWLKKEILAMCLVLFRYA